MGKFQNNYANEMDLKCHLEWALQNVSDLGNKWLWLQHGRVVALEALDASREFQRLGAVGLTEESATVDCFQLGDRAFTVDMKGYRNPRVRVSPTSPLSKMVAGNSAGLGGTVFCKFHIVPRANNKQIDQ